MGHTATPSQGETPETGISIPRDRPPIVIAILGAPAAGKDYLQGRLLEIAKGIGQAELADTLERGSSLAIDEIRDALHQLPSALKLKAFIDAPKQLQTKGLAPWCWRSILDAIGKIDEALDEIAVSVARNGQVLEVSEPLPRDAGHVITSLPETTLQRGLEALHPYGDWRVVVRLEQMKLEAAARQRGDDIVLNETGFDSETMLERLRAFRESNPPYVSLVFLIHGRSAATNLLQNAARMVLGVDDGRDASSSICNTWKHLESVLESYKTCAEITRTVSFKDHEVIRLVRNEISSASANDNTPAHAVDLLTILEPADPNEAYQQIIASIQATKGELGVRFLKAILGFQVLHLTSMDEATKSSLQAIISSVPCKEDLHSTFVEVSKSGLFNHRLNNLNEMCALTSA